MNIQKSILDKPVFMISLDTELAWGFILEPWHRTLALLRSEPQRARETIDTLLSLFERHNIPATWAVVGHLFLNSDEAKTALHPDMPQFKEGWLDWDFYTSICNSPLYYGKDLIERILASPLKHEVGLHSLCHIPFPQCSHEVAEAEIEQGMKLAQKLGVTPESFVFPGNYIGHVDVLRRHGFQIYRGEDARRTDKTHGFLTHNINRVTDFALVSPVLPMRKDNIWEVPGSMYFCEPKLPFTVLPRARVGLTRAIRTGKVFHIYLHPWSLLTQPSLEKMLDKFLGIVVKKREEGKLQVMTMGELATYLNKKND